MTDTSSKLKSGLLTGANDPLEKLLHAYVGEFLANNNAARVVADGLRVLGVGFRPVIDHLTFRALDADVRAQEFVDYGYKFDSKLGVIEYDTWLAKVYRKPGYPTLFVDQAHAGARGRGCVIPEWIRAFSDRMLYHVAVQVDDIENAAYFLEKQGIPMAGNIIGDRGADLRQAFAKPEMRGAQVFTLLELAERHRGYSGFLPPLVPALFGAGRSKKS